MAVSDRRTTARPEASRVLVVGVASILVVFAAMLLTAHDDDTIEWSEVGTLVVYNAVATAIAYGLTVAATRRPSSDRAAKFAVPIAFVALALSVVAFWAGVSMSLGFGAFTIGTWAAREAQGRGWQIAGKVSQIIGLVSSVFAFGLYVYFTIVDWAPGMPR